MKAWHCSLIVSCSLRSRSLARCTHSLTDDRDRGHLSVPAGPGSPDHLSSKTAPPLTDAIRPGGERLAGAYPHSTFREFDFHEGSVDAARKAAAEAGLSEANPASAKWPRRPGSPSSGGPRKRRSILYSKA